MFSKNKMGGGTHNENGVGLAGVAQISSRYSHRQARRLAYVWTLPVKKNSFGVRPRGGVFVCGMRYSLVTRVMYDDNSVYGGVVPLGLLCFMFY